MAKPKSRKLHKNIQVAYQRLLTRDGLLCRQISATEEAKEGGGYLYFDGNGGRAVPPKSSLFLIENHLVEPVEDGLFAGFSQTFRDIDRPAFEAFKAEYEAPAHG